MDAQSSPRDSFASIVANSAQRSYPRQKIHPLVYVNLDQGNGGIVRDLSERGVALQAVARLRVQQQVYLRFELFQPRTRVEAMGQVIWANASGQAGVQFTQISQRTRRLLKEWLLFNLLATADQISSASSIFNDAKRSSELIVSAETAERIAAARREGGRIIAVGTTSLRLLETGCTPGQIVDLPYVWSADETWKRLIFSPEQPFLTDEAEARRQAGLDAARETKRKTRATAPD